MTLPPEVEFKINVLFKAMMKVIIKSIINTEMVFNTRVTTQFFVHRGRTKRITEFKNRHIHKEMYIYKKRKC